MTHSKGPSWILSHLNMTYTVDKRSIKGECSSFLTPWMPQRQLGQHRGWVHACSPTCPGEVGVSLPDSKSTGGRALEPSQDGSELTSHSHLGHPSPRGTSQLSFDPLVFLMTSLGSVLCPRLPTCSVFHCPLGNICWDIPSGPSASPQRLW